ncbi:zinc-ribbon domain-containing protein [Bacillus sp. AC79A.1]
MDNSLAKRNPELSKQWHETKNGELTPFDVAFCSNKKVCIDNCLATLNPEVATEWHPTKNGKLTPYDVVVGSYTKVWWKCKEGHEWETKVCYRTKQGSGCLYRCGQKTLFEKSIVVTHPGLLKEWHPSKNISIDPSTISFGSERKIW